MGGKFFAISMQVPLDVALRVGGMALDMFTFWAIAFCVREAL